MALMESWQALRSTSTRCHLLPRTHMLPIRPDAPRIDVVCAGSPRARGAAQGEALRDKIRACGEALYQLEAFRGQKPWWLPLTGFVRLAERSAMRSLGTVLRSQHPDAWERLQAMSEASGTALRRLMLVNAMEAVLSDLTGTVVTGVEAACSAVAIGPERTAGRGPIVAHNFDYLPLVQPFYVLREERPQGGLRSLQFTVAPLAGVVDGVNEAGLALTFNYAYTTDRAAPSPTLSMRLADVLANCRTVTAAAEQLSSHSRWGSGLIMLADATGDCASLEISPTRSSLRRAGTEGGLSHSNRFCTPEVTAVQIDPTAVHGPHAPAALQGRRVHRSSERRDERLAAGLQKTDRALGPDEIATLMADHGPEGTPSADTICMHSDYWHTTATIQLLPLERRLRIAYAPTCVARYAEFTL